MRRLLISLALLPAAATCAEPEYSATRFRTLKSSEIKINLREQKCLATMIYGEARGEKEVGMIAVAYTAINRAVNNTVCKVVLAPKQYSVFNDNPTLKAAALSSHMEPVQKNIIAEASWDRAMRVAKLVLGKSVSDPTNGSTHYLSPTLMEQKRYKYPRWSKEYRVTVIIDKHHFYKKK